MHKSEFIRGCFLFRSSTITTSIYILFSIFLLANCNDSKKDILNRDPNGTSELQITMREMYEHYDEIKKDLLQGKSIEEVKAFKHILTDIPTEDKKNKTAIYKTMSQVYFNAVEQMNLQRDQEAFKLVVDACMSCHQQICPGPMIKIKKLYVNSTQNNIEP